MRASLPVTPVGEGRGIRYITVGTRRSSSTRYLCFQAEDGCAQAGEPVTARITVDSVSGSRVAFKTECLSDYGTLLVDGVAVALIREQQ